MDMEEERGASSPGGCRHLATSIWGTVWTRGSMLTNTAVTRKALWLASDLSPPSLHGPPHSSSLLTPSSDLCLKLHNLVYSTAFTAGLHPGAGPGPCVRPPGGTIHTCQQQSLWAPPDQQNLMTSSPKGPQVSEEPQQKTQELPNHSTSPCPRHRILTPNHFLLQRV